MFSDFELALAGAHDEDDFNEPVKPPFSKAPEHFEDDDYQEVQSFKRPKPAKQRQSDFNFGSFQATQQPHQAKQVAPPPPQENYVVAQPLQVQDDVMADFQSILKDLRPEQLPVASGPLKTRPRDTGRLVVPFSTRQAAATLLQDADDGLVRLGMSSTQELQQIYQCDDEYTTVDPLIVISDTLFTGTCNVYLAEVIHVSTLVLALYLNCHYSITLFQGATPSNPKKFAQVQIAPFEGIDPSTYAQPFHCEKLVQQALLERYPNDVDLRLFYVSYHMASLGPMSSAACADMSFVEEEAKLIGSVLANEKRSGDGGPLMGFAGSGRE